MGPVIEGASRVVVVGLLGYGAWLWWHRRLYEGINGQWAGDLSPPPPRFTDDQVQAAQANIDPEPVGLMQTEPQPDIAADQLDWSTIDYFRPSEFITPDGQSMLDFIHPDIIKAADEFRRRLGVPVMISPAAGAMARFSGSKTSQHYAVGRRSTALDVMPAAGTSLRAAYRAAESVRLIGGIGVYPDWRPRPGLHLDTRPRKPDGSVASWMGVRTPAGQQYAAIDWDLIEERTA